MNRNLSLDYLKLILAFFVVGLHAQFLFDLSKPAYFATTQGLFRIAVPIFLIISGYYFLNVNTVDMFKKWSLRILSLYAIWMIIYTPFWLNTERILLSLFTIINGYYVLWYLIGTFFSGVIVFLLRNKSKSTLFFIILSTFLIGLIIQTLGNLHILPNIIDKIFNLNFVHRNAILMCLPFFLLGYYINKYNLDQKIKVSFLMILISIGFLISESLLNYYFISKTEGLDQLLFLIVVAPLIFIYTKNKFISGESKEISNYSTAIYLIHPILLLTFFKYLQYTETLTTVLAILASCFFAIILVHINKKIKYIL